MTTERADTNYQCNDCLRITDTPISRHYREYDGLDCGPYRVSVELQCPYCAGVELEEVELCPACELERVYADYDVCIGCAQKSVSSVRLTDVIKEIALTPMKKL
jgi:hypothetical protein